MKKTKQRKAKKVKRPIPLVFMVSEQEKALMVANSILFTGGNLSEWIRLAAKNYEG